MSKTELVRASRDGDQFHYLWAARRCLRLLDPRCGLVAIAIEGASQSEAPAGEQLEGGEELIDVAEYYGSESISQAERISYIQLKHSTFRVAEVWTPSELGKTLRGFSERYRELLRNFDKASIQKKVTFCFVSNRRIQRKVLEAISDAAASLSPRHDKILKRLGAYTGLDGPELSEFCRLLRFDGSEDDYWEQRNLLLQDMTGYLSSRDADAPVQLKELVTRKALSESSKTPVITKLDVLRALKVDENDLFPARCLIRSEQDAVPREQEGEFNSAIIDATDRPVIIHAAGGVGKSVFATRIGLGLPEGSVCILYDCFGNAQYRNASGFRHRHKDAIPQIANELAAQGLCHPLIPTPSADSSSYLRSFLHRLRQSVTLIKAEHPNALLCIVIDAADNAQMAAEEVGERRSFVRDLLRETLPGGVRLVALCRSHRQDKLDPPPNARTLELSAFSRAETAKFLRNPYPDATDHDVDEFHRLSSQNPRVQALAISGGDHLGAVLRQLGPNPTTVEDTINALLDQAIARIRDAAGSIEEVQIDKICAGLAALRPLIPIPVLAEMSGVPETAIQSFALDLGRPLIVTDGTIQFFDEPAETWFRERFKPNPADLPTFIESLKPIASKSAYVASVLPQLMLQAGQHPELVDLALSSEGLPENSPLERRDVELQRLQFALKASLRSKHYLFSAKLALKAASETAGDERQRKLLQDNTDLAAVFLETGSVQEIVSRRIFGSGWIGSQNAYEAGLMSGNSDLAADARSRLRMANQWLDNWSRLPDEERSSEEVTVDDIAEIAIAEHNIHGAARAAYSFRRWRPRDISFRAGAILARRFVDQGRYQELEQLALAAGNDLYLLLAITREMRAVHQNPPKRPIERALRLLLDRRVQLAELKSFDSDETILHAVVTLVEAAILLGASQSAALLAVLDKQLPEEPNRGLASPHGKGRCVLIRAYTLRAALANRSLELTDLAHPALKKQLRKGPSGYASSEAMEFKRDIASLLPWHRLWAEALLGRISAENMTTAIERVRAKEGKVGNGWSRNEAHTSNEIARLWLEILIMVGAVDANAVGTYTHWTESLESPLFTTALTEMARLATRCQGLEEHALEFASRAFQMISSERDSADAKAEAYIALSRAILALSKSEAGAYFNEAVEVASKIGYEVIDRWDAIIALTNRSAAATKRDPEIAYRFARCAEMVYEYIDRDKHFDWSATICAMTELCPSSAVTILSRWRDRGFGSPRRGLRIAIQSLLDRGHLDPKTAIGLVPFRADWDLSGILKSALGACPKENDEKQEVLDLFYRYASLEGQSAATWKAVKQVCASHGLTLSEIDELIRIAENRDRLKKSADENLSSTLPEMNGAERSHEWAAIFEGVNVLDASDIARAYERFRSYEPPCYVEDFFREICQRVPPGKEAEFIRAVSDLTSFDLYEYRSFLEHIPETWMGRASTRPAIALLVRSIAQRFCMEITKSRYYQPLPLDLACSAAGLAEEELIDTTLSAIGEATQIVGPGRLFTLVGLLVVKLTPTEAREALCFALGHLEASLEERDGDGPWIDSLVAPAEIDEAVAGYLWAALAVPQASFRWEAAHSVRAMCLLGQERVLSHLMTMCANGEGGPFADARLHFYQLHATQWLLIALARAVKENPAMIAPFGQQLSQLALGKTEHILIREFAARAAAALVARGYYSASTDEKKRLSEVNSSSLPVVNSKWHERRHRQPAGPACVPDDDHFFFGIDMGPYWFEPLGRCFGTSQAEVERLASSVIREEWGFAGITRWDDDERARRGLYREGEDRHSHGSYPRADNLRFYFSYHAMMVVAGKLLSTHSLHEDPEDSWGDFRAWFARHELARADGNWLADRRDSAPLEWPDWKDEISTENWRWSLTRDDFDKVLFRPDGKVTVSGHWTEFAGQRQQIVHITSALVSTGRSEALLRALQTASNPHDYRIPDADDEGEIDHGEFRLKGWVVQQTKDSGIDRLDPWAGDIHFPPIRPAKFVREAMGLAPDSEERVWVAKNEERDESVLWSRLWGQPRDNDDEDERESGQRLEAAMSFIRRLLITTGNDLLVEVEMNRQQRYSRFTRREDDGLGYVPPSAKLFLIRGDGSVHTA